MFVPPSSSSSSPFHQPHAYPSPPKALAPVPTLVESESCIHLPRLSLDTGSGDGGGGGGGGGGGLQKSIQDVLRSALPAIAGLGVSLVSLAPGNLTRRGICRGLFGVDGAGGTITTTASVNDNGVPLTGGNEADASGLRDRSNPRTRAPFGKPQATQQQKPGNGGRGGSWQLKQFAEATLGSGSLRKAVKLPEGEDLNEWLAVNVVDFYNQINLLYGSITEFCSPQSCPEMKATDEYEYLWQDSTNYKRPTKMPAPEYIEHLLSWAQSNMDNEAIFPSRIGAPFPKTFQATLKQIFKRLYRVYAHIYCHHYPVVLQLGLEPHLNTSFKHYCLFVDEHGLNQGSRDFWGPLGDLVESFLRGE